MRKEKIINDGWYFTKARLSGIPFECDEKWESVSLPHTWNALDGQDGGANYFRGECHYLKELYIPEKRSDTEYFLRFDAAASVCTVYVNGKEVCTHKGGYSAFCADLTDVIASGTNVIVARVTNEPRTDIYPQMADFTFYGGLHRSVTLITVQKTHFELDYFGADGFTVSSEPESMSGGKASATLCLNTYIKNASDGDTVRYTVLDKSGERVLEVFRSALAPHIKIKLDSVNLWQGVKNPYLYTVTAELIRGNEVLDCLSVRHGFRSFYVDPQKGFFLNGELTPLRGVSRHQDKGGIGNALGLGDHIKDAELIKEIGANTVRLAHYQQSREFYGLCDELGFVVWAEIPFISRMMDGDEARENTLSQMRELIYQNFNHSSICFWGISNEITIGGANEKLIENLSELNELCHKIDATRATTMAQVSPLPIGDTQNLITDVLAYNHYFGWYGGALTDNEKWIDKFHETHPSRPLGISEYGAEGIITYHSDSPRAGDYTEEYQALYHEHMLKVFEKRPWIWGTYVWNMFDFGCDARDEGGVAGRNNKGLVTIDRKIKKDAFYLYKASWSDIPVVHVCGKRYAYRTGETLNVKVYSNQPSVTLTVNGKSYEAASADGCVYVFENVPLSEGINTVSAVAGAIVDTAFFEKTDTLPGSYTLKADESETGVTNWFDDRDMSRPAALFFKEGRYSVKSTVRELLENDKAGDILINAFSSVTGMRLKKSMLMMMAEQTPEELFKSQLAAAKPELNTDAMLSLINEELQKIKKS